MNVKTYVMRNGYDGKQCFVHARCCFAPNFALATAQYLNVKGSDLFSGIFMSKSLDGGKTWSEFVPQEGLLPIVEEGITTVGCDGTPMYHKKTGKILLLGHTAQYTKDALHPILGDERKRHTFYSVYDEKTDAFTKMKFLNMPEGYECCGNGSGQSLELEDGNILVPMSFTKKGEQNSYSCVALCSFDGENVKVLKVGNALTVTVERGLVEPSIVFHKGMYYMTIRNDECGFVAKSKDGLNYTDLQLWKWEDGSILQNYNTQQHWFTLGDDLYLVYTRRGADNDHVFRHRAPLFAARVENMRLVRDSEFVVVPERGARLGNFDAKTLDGSTAVVMAAEWMQPIGCEKYGSDNSIFVSFVSKE